MSKNSSAGPKMQLRENTMVILSLAGLIIGGSFPAAANPLPADRCQTSLQFNDNKESDSSAPFPANPRLSVLLENGDAFSKDGISSFFYGSSFRRQFEIAQKQLRILGVEFEIEKSNGIIEKLLKKPKLIIRASKNGSQLNQLAFALKKSLGVSLIYKPHDLGNTVAAYYLDFTKEICLSHNNIMSGKLDITTFHEIRHAALSSKLARGNPTLYEGNYYNSGNVNKDDTYGSYLSFQEISTYSQDAKYAHRAVYDPSAEKLSDANYRTLARNAGYEIRHAGLIIKKAQEHIQEALHLVNSGKGTIHLVDSNDRFLVLDLIMNDDVRFDFTIPLEAPINEMSSPLRELLSQHIRKLDNLAGEKRDYVRDLYKDLIDDGLIKLKKKE